ncbi:hypothetical protein LY76DRAFT_590304 [Colletotrichum caudatum]|nr:hypothetical protein LY76DRAFT_590304 [Colletotrichum caudatum]
MYWLWTLVFMWTLAQPARLQRAAAKSSYYSVGVKVRLFRDKGALFPLAFITWVTASLTRLSFATLLLLLRESVGLWFNCMCAVCYFCNAVFAQCVAWGQTARVIGIPLIPLFSRGIHPESNANIGPLSPT